MQKIGIPIVVIDGMGIWWGLRVSADGLHAGLPIVVFGGEHADLPLVPEKAAEMARAVVESNISCVLDLSPFSKYAARKIVSAFLNELYRLNRVERHVFIEESDLWAPQRPIGQDEALCLSAVDNFVRRGGNHNLGCTLITQRSAVLNKDILTQSDCLVVLRTPAPQDKKAIQAWVEEQTEEDKSKLNKWYDTLKELENGEAWVWHPEKPAIFVKVKFRQRETFHATREFIRSPRASKIVLMSVNEFVDSFKKVFQSGVTPQVVGSDPTSGQVVRNAPELKALEAELEEFRSGRKLAESVQKRLEFLGSVKFDLEKRLNAADKALEVYNNLQSALRTAINVQNIYDNIHRVEEKIPAATLPMQPPGSNPGGAVGLQKVTKILTLEENQLIVPTIRTDTVKGKILALAQNGFFDAWQSVGDINAKLIDDFRCNTSDQAINGALKELVEQQILGLKHTDRNRWKLGLDVVFEEEKDRSVPGDQ